MSHDVFISFSSKDSETAKRICGDLEARGIACWISSRDIAAGSDFAESIVTAIEAARAMVFVFSDNANNSAEMKKELVLAGDCHLPVLPVRIEDVLPTGAYRYQLTTRQYLDLFQDWNANLAELAREITRLPNARPALQTPEPDVGRQSRSRVTAPPKEHKRVPIRRFAIASCLVFCLLGAAYYAWQHQHQAEPMAQIRSEPSAPSQTGSLITPGPALINPH